MLRIQKRALCHPDRPHEARGLCPACYKKEYMLERMAGLRVPRVYQVNVSGLVRGIEEMPVIPAALRDRSHTFTRWPDACPKCGRTAPLQREGRELHCVGAWAGCGWTGALVRDAPPTTTPS